MPIFLWLIYPCAIMSACADMMMSACKPPSKGGGER
jgi:hypothetical protein